jgi:hypothetical protein
MAPPPLLARMGQVFALTRHRAKLRVSLRPALVREANPHHNSDA